MTIEETFKVEGFTLREATPDDSDELVALINDGYSYLEKYRSKPRTSSEHLREHSVDKQFYAVEHDSEIVACFYIENKGKVSHFGMLVVTDRLRGTGLGRAIVGSVEESARSNDNKSIELDYMSITPWLKKYYEKLGFMETGEIEKWGEIDLIKMEKLLA